MITQPSVIDQMVAKYSGGDEAYATKLKSHMRDAFGYSNFVSQLERETGSAAPIGDIKGLSPAGIRDRIGTRFGMQDENVRTLEGVASAVDTTAGKLAAEQIAREKAAAAKAKEAAGTFEPTDWLDRQIQSFQINRPKNEDGTEMTLDQFKTQLFGKVMGEGEASDVLFQPGLSEDVINQRIKERTPEDYDERRAFYQARQSGATKAEAEDFQSYDDYKNGKMAPGQKQVYELLNPTRAAQVQELGKDITIADEVKEKNDNGAPKYTYQELREKHPDVPQAKFDEVVYPTFKKYAQEDIGGMMNEQVKGVPKIDTFKEIYTGGVDDKEGLDAVQSTKNYAAIKKYLEARYGDVVTPAELDRMISTYVLRSIDTQ